MPTTKGFDYNVTWEPLIDGNRVGYKVTRKNDGAVTYICHFYVPSF